MNSTGELSLARLSQLSTQGACPRDVQCVCSHSDRRKGNPGVRRGWKCFAGVRGIIQCPVAGMKTAMQP